MSKLFNPKAWYLVGIGAAALALDGTRRWVKKRREEAERSTEGQTEIPMMAASDPFPVKQTPATPKPVATPTTAPTASKPDDLTEIKGIGPTFARRLAEAGITTFAAVAAASPDFLREVTKATAVAKPDEWIAQARAMA